MGLQSSYTIFKTQFLYRSSLDICLKRLHADTFQTSNKSIYIVCPVNNLRVSTCCFSHRWMTMPNRKTIAFKTSTLHCVCKCKYVCMCTIDRINVIIIEIHHQLRSGWETIRYAIDVIEY